MTRRRCAAQDPVPPSPPLLFHSTPLRIPGSKVSVLVVGISDSRSWGGKILAGRLYLAFDVHSTKGRLFCLFEDLPGFASQYSNVAVALVFEETITAVTLNEFEALAQGIRWDVILIGWRVVIVIVKGKLSDEKGAAYIGFESSVALV